MKSRHKYKKYATLISPQYHPIDIPFNTYDKQANMTKEEIEKHYNTLKTHEDRAKFISGLTDKNLDEIDKSVDKSIYETEIKSAQENFNTYEEIIKNMNGEAMVNYYNTLTRKQQVDFINTLTSLQGKYNVIFEDALIKSIFPSTYTGYGKRNKKRSTRRKKRRGKY
jgi:hypothetical protein